ncbi:MAG TPA: VOC family protein [Acidimicrobiales bacterium]|nr:VOC family protein [Acidimicrobiales bacterium]
MATTAVQLFSLPVSDQDRSRDFYVATLGFELVGDVVMGPDQRRVQARPPGGVDHPGEPFETMPPGAAQGTVLETDDLDGDVAALDAKGVRTVGGVRQAPRGRFVTFDESDGNGLVFHTTH